MTVARRRRIPPSTGPRALSVIASSISASSGTRKPQLQNLAAAGVTHVVALAPWDQLQTTSGGAVTTTNLKGYLDDAQAVGLRVVVEIGLQYCPTFYRDGVEQYKDQNATLWTNTGTAGSGANGDMVRNWVWTTTGRNYIADLFTKLGASGIAYHPAVAGIRLGCGYSGECQYAPIVTSPLQWWIFGASCQSGTGLASDQVVCPNPGRTPVWDGSNNAADNAIGAWWVNGLTVAMVWLIGQAKSAGFGGAGQCIWVLHPSHGLRNRTQMSGSTALIASQAQEVARGVDPEALMAGYYRLGNVWPWSTWNNYYSASLTEANMPSCVKLLQLAQQYGLLARFGCENTGGETNSGAASTSLDGCMQVWNGPLGARGWLFNWLNYTDLVSGDPNYNVSPSGTKATLTYLKQQFAALGR